MKIEVVSGAAQGQTELGAYDAAEMKMGVANCNLIRLSSVIPPGCEVVDVDGPTSTKINWGDKVYAVYAERHTSEPGEAVWAGVGWVMLDGKKGLFCEHDGRSRESVERLITTSLMNFMKSRGLEPDESLIQIKVVGAVCEEQSACAMVLAVYQAEGW